MIKKPTSLLAFPVSVLDKFTFIVRSMLTQNRGLIVIFISICVVVQLFTLSLEEIIFITLSCLSLGPVFCIFLCC
jgi:hypothetical protein